MISVVNGYVCMSGCEAAKAKRGQDPHEKANDISAQKDPVELAKRALSHPAVSFGGSLSTLNGVGDIGPSPSPTQRPVAGQKLDVSA